MTTETFAITTCWNGKTYEISKLEKEFGSVTHDGLTVTLIQQAYLSHDGQMDPLYEAVGIDVLGNKYRVIWDITNTETDDEGDACEWDNPASVTMVEAND